MVFHRKEIIFKFLLVVVCMRYDELVAAETRCIERERQALLRFKQELTDEYGVLSSWGSEDHQKECCNWQGVVCSNSTGHVTGLLPHDPYKTSEYRFGGKISPALLELHHLNYLDLGGNDFGGNRIPDFIGSIKMLEHLDLGGSNFSGIIPPQLGNLTNLRTLILRANNLWSDSLYWLSDLSWLTRLEMSYSNISDTNWLQHVVLNLPALQRLHMRSCMLGDVIASSADLFVNSSSSSLSYLFLPNNQLTSSTFDWLFNISYSLVSIGLSSNKLDGQIPDAFGKLNFLEYLYLSENMCEGVIPKSLGNLSRLQSLYLDRNDMGSESREESLGNLSCQAMVSLENLDLSDNKITGPLPDLRACSGLRRLYVGSNRLTGPLLPSLALPPMLEELDISDNSLQGIITEANFVELQNLKNLDLAFNSLTLDLSADWIPPFQLEWINLRVCKMARGSFPTWLQTQTNISSIDISDAGISGEVPRWVWNMSDLEYVNLSHNQISGTIPDLSSASSIIILDVGSNNFSGSVPILNPKMQTFQLSFNNFTGSISSICIYAVCSLQWLDVSNNQLEGALPSDWANMKDLVILNVNYNNLSGEIPHSLGSLSKLRTLHLRGNNFSGELPTTLRNCRLLQLMDIGENRFTGNIPPWLGENLAFLSLTRNMFYGFIPPEICRLTQIQLLDLSDNNLTGKIPKCFDNFTALVDKNWTTTTSIVILYEAPWGYMDYALVQWKGRSAEYNRILGLLKLIDLSSNKLVGSIPESFSKLKGLISLNLSRNGLTGSIIPGIGEMETLEILDLSSNQLSGKIPTGLAQLNSLAVLHLENNNLSGEIPKSTQLQSFDASFYAGNDRLCGSPLQLCVNTSIITDQGDDDDDGSLTSLSSTQEFCITLAFGFIVGFWGVVGSSVLKRSWRYAYFNFFDAIGNRFYGTAAVFLHKFRRS
ncbi:hypothetical protein ACS0TY_018959 [Phlomoides rotata]